MVYGWAKLFGTTPDYVLHEVSYENLLMYSCAVPHYDDEKEEVWDESLDANNPNNFSNHEEEVFVR